MTPERLPMLKSRQVIKALSLLGFEEVRQKGSHVRLEKNMQDGIIKITVPAHDTLKKGTLHQIIKASGLNEEDFL